MRNPDQVAEAGPSPAIPVYVVQQDIDAASAQDLKQRLLEQLVEEGPDLRIDLSRVAFIDSTGLGMLVGILREARLRGGTVRLLNPGREVRRILQITGLENLFEIGTTARP